MIEIKWNDLVLVAGAAIGASALVVTLVSIGVRLLTNGQAAVGTKGKPSQSQVSKEIAYRLAAVVSFLLASGVLAYGLYIIVTFSKLNK